MDRIPCEAFDSTIMCEDYRTEGKEWNILPALIQVDIPIRCPEYKRVFSPIGKLDPS